MQYKIRILPRWLIFMLDLSCILISLFFSFLFRFNFQLEEVASYPLSVILPTALLINAVLFYLLKSYAGIIRYTNIEDMFRLLVVNSTAVVFYLSINFVVNYSIEGVLLFPASIICINFFVSNFSLITYRFLVRYFFKYYQTHQTAKTGFPTSVNRAAVYDAKQDGLQTKKVINEFQNSGLQVVAFVDEILSRSGKLIEGLPIYDIE